MKVFLYIISALAILALINSCTQPAGPTGPTGATGPTGSSDYLVYTESINPTINGGAGWSSSDSSANGVINQDYYNHTFTGFSIQPTINGELPVVEVYYSTSNGSGATYYPLPTSVWGNDWLSFSWSTTKVNLIYLNTNNFPIVLPQTIYIKIVIIPVP